MTETSPEVPITPTPELKRPERLSNEQMDDLLAAFGNHEAKALTLIAMSSGGGVFSRGNLHKAIFNAQGQEPGWKMHNTGPFNYCADSLSPIGLVTKEVLNEDLSTFGFQITDFGKDTGIPLAGLLLDFSQRHNIPLNKIFASTASSASSDSENAESETAKKRAPGTTRKILYELITSPSLPMRQRDLEANVKENTVVLLGHLQRLNEAGLIDYQSTEVNQSVTYYQLKPHTAPDTPPVYRQLRTLSNAVFEILKSNPGKFLTSHDITDSLPEEMTKTWVDKTGLRRHVSAILKNLEKEGWANIDKFQQGVQSEINLSEEQRAVISELIEILDRFQDQDPEILEEGRKLASGIWADPQSVSVLMLRAKNASGPANQWATSETEAAILSIVQAHPEGITNRQIREALEELHDKRLGTTRIREVIADLTDGKTIDVQTKGRVRTFFPVLPPEE